MRLAVAVVAAALCAAPHSRALGAVYYVAPGGADSAAGTIDAPWSTIAGSLGKLAAGDTLLLRGGTYFESGIPLNVRGRPDAWITLQSFPGERPVIDGGVPDFRSAPNADWEVVDPVIGLHRSARVFPPSGFFGAALPDDGVNLIAYDDAANLESTDYGPLNGMRPFYNGPGVQHRPDGRVYIRLRQNPNDLTDAGGAAIAPVPADADPNHNRVAVFFSFSLFEVGSPSYLLLRDLAFAHAANYLFNVDGGDHVVIDGCTFDLRYYGMVFHKVVADWEIRNSDFRGGLPQNVYWGDVKNPGGNPTEPRPEFQSFAIELRALRGRLHHNSFRASFDGIWVARGTADTEIVDNTFRDLRDDAINLEKGIRNVEVARNVLWRVGEGISPIGSPGRAGPVYVHHNVIDNSALQRGGRPGNADESRLPPWWAIDPFGQHTRPTRAWWRLYNNTVVTRKNPGYPGPTYSAEPFVIRATKEYYVYNNLFYVIDDRVVFASRRRGQRAHYDGNAVWQGLQTGPLFFDFWKPRASYASLAELQATGATWERLGLEVDPGFDLEELEDPTFDPATILDRYRPTNPQVLTAGIAYDGLAWPGTAGVTYRGAVAP